MILGRRSVAGRIHGGDCWMKLMNENDDIHDIPTSAKSYQFRVRDLLFATTLVASTLGLFLWLGWPWNWPILLPVAIIVLLGLRTRWHTSLGCFLGMATFAVVGWIAIGYPKSDPSFARSMAFIVTYGGSWGAGIHALLLRRWILGALSLAITLAAFAALMSLHP
jgi:hypothetical protein